MKGYVIRRLSQTLLSIFVVATLMFILFRLMPSDPTATTISPALNPTVRESMAAKFGLNEPLHIQYLKYMRNVVTFDFGQSFFQNRLVRTILFERVTNTFMLMGPAVLIAFSVGTLLGALAAWYHGSDFEYTTLITAVLFRSTPSFVTGLFLLHLFAFELQWLPVGHMVSFDVRYSGPIDMFFSVDFLRHLLLPVASVVPFILAFPTLLMRTTMLEVKDQDFIMMCYAKGVRERRIFFNHAIRNSILPVITVAPIVMGLAVTGNILIETIYSWPGIGRTLVDAVLQGDFPLAQGTFLLIAVIVIFGNFLVDLVYVWLDPRISYE